MNGHLSSYVRRAQRVVDFTKGRFPQVPSDARRTILGLYESGVQFSKQRSVARQSDSWPAFVALANTFSKSGPEDELGDNMVPPSSLGSHASLGWVLDELEKRWGVAPSDALEVCGYAKGVGLGPGELTDAAEKSVGWEAFLDHIDDRTESLEE